MTSDRVCAPSGEDEENTALDYYDEEDDLEAFSDADLGCEDGGRRIFVLLRKVTRRQRASLPLCLTHSLIPLVFPSSIRSVITRSIYGKHTASVENFVGVIKVTTEVE